MKIMTLLFTLTLSGLSFNILADESLDQGKALTEKNCQNCHQSEVYTRKDHRMTSLTSLETQVGRCEKSLGLQWFNEDIENTAKWLNHSYYHFEQ